MPKAYLKNIDKKITRAIGGCKEACKAASPIADRLSLSIFLGRALL
ncbi:MAG: hypothetical protein F6J93_07885 [Oscillatoria sp. SIO1A7]|nr:hypothetical protein [Oscillatoria sp. SIO1A7]